LPDGIKDIVHGFGEDRKKLFYQTNEGQYLSQEDARDAGVTHSTTPQPSKDYTALLGEPYPKPPPDRLAPPDEVDDDDDGGDWVDESEYNN